MIQLTCPQHRYREYKVKEEEKARLKAEMIQRREEKIAKGEELGPEDELEKEPSAILALLRVFLVFIGITMALGWFITGSVFWEYDGKWVRLSTYLPVSYFFRDFLSTLLAASRPHMS